MARKRVTPSSIECGIERHYDALEKGEYVPWHKAADVPSAGRAREAWGKTHQRVHHLLSDIEYHYFLHLDFKDEVIGIYEQFPLLPPDETQKIARSLGIKHPNYPGTKIPFIFTVDFYIDYQSTPNEAPIQLARSIKPVSELLNTTENYKNTLAKLEIEKAYFKLRGIDWKLVTDKSFNTVAARNLQWLGKDIRGSEFFEEEFEEFIQAFSTIAIDCYVLNLKKAIQQIAMRMKRSFEETNRLFRHAIWFKYLTVDITGCIISPMTEVEKLKWSVGTNVPDYKMEQRHVKTK